MTSVDSAVVRAHVVVTGLVQGVGFRPFVYRVATRYGLAGSVRNEAGVVRIEVEGAPAAVGRFVHEVRDAPPPRALVEDVRVTGVPAAGGLSFTISDSVGGPTRHPSIAPDIAVCANCLDELFDPAGRRDHHAFITCVDCGPRVTIIRSLPYDRAATTMADFPMCDRCAAEYADPADRRFHAEPTCCPGCGPRLALLDLDGELTGCDPLTAAARRLLDGQILAVKGIGGYHLVADATDDRVLARLRDRKRRPDQPFAVMVADLPAANRVARIDAAAQRSLCSYRAPIVLLDRRPGAPLSALVAPGSTSVGLMVPHTPVQHLLTRAVARPLVFTSGNAHGEPIAFDDGDARSRLAGVADAFLAHDRPIETGLDDSVVTIVMGRELVTRRARGYVPEPVDLPVRSARPVLALGNHVKSTFCLLDGDRSYLSPHLGSLEDYDCLRAYRRAVRHYRRVLGIRPEVVAHDLHPGSVALAQEWLVDGAVPVRVQHHHAHIASCLVENGVTGPVIGVAFDGLGMGPDGTLWGGEFLIADLTGFRRAAHLEPTGLPGGDAAVREPWRMAASWLARSLDRANRAALPVARRHEEAWETVERLAATGLRSPLTSSAGRLFDAVAALLGVADTVSYEGQAAILLEQLAGAGTDDGYPVRLAGAEPVVLRASDLVRGAADDLAAGVPREVVAGRFHNGLADAVVEACVRLRADAGPPVVALTGGVFQNRLLSTRVATGLTSRGFSVLSHSRVPAGDGGVSLGQAAVAAATLR